MKEPESTMQLPLAGPKSAAPGKPDKKPGKPDKKIAPLSDRIRQPPPAAADKPQPRALWYALHLPQLTELAEKLQRQHLEQLARLATEVSSSVSFHPCSLIFEIRSSLRYFGGINSLHELLASRVTEQLETWGLDTQLYYAASPTVTGSLLLARGGRNLLVYRRDNLRSALGRLSTDVLEVDREQRRRLYNMGIRRLQDLWRLPGDGLRKRFGSNFVNQLHRALGERPEPQKYYQPPPAFSSSYDLPCEMENVQLLLPVLEEFLAQLVDFLRRRDLSTSRLVVSLIHERQSSTDITLGLRLPSRCRQHLLQLLEIHFNNLVIPAPVVALKMQVIRFDAYLGESAELLQDSGRKNSKGEHLDLFLEQLQARVGEHPIRKIGSVAEHCPEYATPQQEPLPTTKQSRNRQYSDNPRPFWLLPEPQILKVRSGRLYHRRSLQILSGPERIETRWWSGTDIRRDYYVALEENGSRLWIYREKSGERRWFLHGIFA
ncbi:MAG: DNA polymerase Y family protein [Gammaproteobacteria bacterium]|nr:DNA polymerase Y family protein [Gammaproteobacteria bacterium]